MGADGEAVWEVVEGGPDGRDHDLEALAALIALSACLKASELIKVGAISIRLTKPDDCDDTTNGYCELRTAHPEGGAAIDWKIDTEHCSDVAIEHGWYADEGMTFILL